MNYGHFDTDHDNTSLPQPDVPVSWTNCLCTTNLCAVLSHNVGGYSYYQASKTGRITRFEASCRGIDARQTVFIPQDDDVELRDVRVTNTIDLPRELTVGSDAEFNFHPITIDNQNLQMSLYDSGYSFEDGIIEYDFYYEP